MSGSAGVSQPSWQGSAASRPTSTKPARFALLLILLGLVLGFGWLIVQLLAYQPPRTHFVLVKTGPIDRLSAPPLPFERGTLGRLEEAAAGLRLAGDAVIETTLQEASQAIDRLRAEPSDVVLVYVHANGVSADAKSGRLLTGAFDLNIPQEGAILVEDLVQAVANQPASAKVILFDAGRVAPDPRRGVLANRFASAVDAAVQSADDPSLFAITSHADQQVSGIGQAERCTPLGAAVATSLSGLATDFDGQADEISLADLGAFSLVSVAEASGGAQTPVLASTAVTRSKLLDDRAASTVIAWRTAPPSTGENDRPSADDEPSEEDASEQEESDGGEESPETTPEEPSDVETAGPGDEQVAAEAATETPATDDGDATDTEVAAPPQALVQAWEAFHRMRSPDDRAAPSPEVGAPHRWRRIARQLTVTDLLAGGDNLPSLAQDAEVLLEDLLELEKSLRSGGVTAFPADWPPSLTRAFADCQAATSNAAELVDYHAGLTACTLNGAPSTLTDSITKLIGAIREANAEYARLSTTPLTSWEDARRFEGTVRTVRSARRAADRLLNAQLDAGIENVSSPAERRRLEALLQTSLLDASQRERARKALAAVEPPQLPGRAVIERAIRQNPRSEKTAASLKHAKLVTRLARLAGYSSRAEARTLTDLTDLQSSLREFFSTLPQSLSVDATSPDAINEPTRIVAAAVVHPVDAPSITSTPRLGVALRAPARFTLAALGSNAARPLRLGEPMVIRWRLEAKNIDAPGVTLTLGGDENADELLDLRLAESSEPIRLGDSWDLTLAAGGGPIDVAIEVSARKTVTADARRLAELELTAAAEGQPAVADTASIRLPRPIDFTLMARCVDPELPWKSSENGILRLRPYPNRTTEFEFALRNESDNVETVDFALAPAPALRSASWAPGLLASPAGEVFSPLQGWLDGQSLEALCGSAVAATAKPITLAAGKAAERLRLARPAAPAAEGEDPPAERAPDGVSNGLLGIVTRDKGEPKRLLFWIELTPQRPAEYLDFDGWLERGRAGGYRLVVDTALRTLNRSGGRRAPPGVAKQPISVTLAGNCKLFPGPILFTEIDGERGSATLARDVPSGARSTFSVAADRYPRAFVAEADTGATNDEGIEPADEYTAIAIQSVAMSDSLRESRLRWDLSPPAFPPPKKEPEGVESRSLACDPRSPCVFDVRRGGSDIEVRLAVDAPPDAFHSDQQDGRGDYVNLRLSEDTDTGWTSIDERRLYADRRTTTQLVDVSGSGGLRLRCRVRDQSVRLKPRAGVGSDSRLRVNAELFLNGRRVADDDRLLLLDARPPEISFLLDERRLPSGATQVKAIVVANDLSGIQQLEAWVTKSEAQPEDPAAFAKRLEPARSGRESAPRREALDIPFEGEPDRYYVHLRAVDGSGKAEFAKPMRFVVLKPEPTVEEAEQPLIGDIRGVLLAGGKAAHNIAVAIKGKPNFTAKSARDGTFVIKNVPGGTYTLTAEGAARNIMYEGEMEIELAEPGDYQGHKMTLQRPEKD
ncbi:MAG: carboxypeptidase-like regulatory domain-containing protein [Planctomycetota bacterium]